MKEELQKLIEQYGADAVAKAATEALNKQEVYKRQVLYRRRKGPQDHRPGVTAYFFYG